MPAPLLTDFLLKMTPSSAESVGSGDARLTNVTGTASIANIMARREKAPRLPTGIAPHTHSDLFKGPQGGKPKAKRWDHHLSEESRTRQPSSLKGAAKYLANPGLISLGGGLPSSEYFPIERLDIKVPRVGNFSEAETRESGLTVSAGKHDIAEGKGAFDLHVALNYGQGVGSAQLLRFVTEHTELVHNPPYRDWRCALTIGSTSSFDMSLRMLTKPGDYIMTEEYSFSSSVETARAQGLQAVGIRMDKEGLLPEAMDELLSSWDTSARGGKKPTILYTVPSGQNPTGATQGLQRRRAIYRVAQKHDVLILEDEPYYFLQMQPYTGPDAPDAPPPKSHDEFLRSLVPSLLSLDVDGRVLRFDSFSKVIAPGSRVGWITASEQIIDRYTRHSDQSTQAPSGLSQIALYKLLEETWGHAGYLDWLINIRLQYTRRRGLMLDACERYLPKEVASWNPPMAGMFVRGSFPSSLYLS
jgi:aromatic amino acid aminotransferase I